MKQIDSKLLKKFVRLASEKLTGEWVIIGGTVLPLLGIYHRVTVDIDIINKSKRANSADLQLMNIASEIGLPVESINQAGAFFLQKISGWQDELIPIAKARASIYRPSATLYLALKMERMSESDLLDCGEMLKFAKKSREKVDFKRLRSRLAKKLQRAEVDATLSARLKNFEKLLEKAEKL